MQGEFEGGGPASASGRYFNRELSWLQFNRRVLAEASHSAHPLLERLRFLAISGANLDEFIMVRVAGLRGQQLRRIEALSIDGLTPGQALERIEARSAALMAEQHRCWSELRPLLAAEGIEVLGAEEITPAQSRTLDRYFTEQLFPVLTPQALDPAHPFPFIPNLGLSLMFDLRHRATGAMVHELIMIPSGLPRFIEPEPGRFVPVEAVLRHFAGRIFPAFDVLGSAVFRVIRDSDIELEEEAEDLVLSFRTAILRRRRGRVIHVVTERVIPPALRSFIAEQLGGEATVTESDALLGLADFEQIVAIDRPDLKFEPYTARFPERIREHDGDCFAAIRQKDIIVHHPYESFDVVLAFLRQAANDPDVLAVKQTLYRAGKQGAVIRALCDAAEAGKSVTAVVELKARFDEEQNLRWAEQLERAGVQVVYGFIELKTHAKCSMVVRREGQGTRSYCHFGTGNYHPQTARTYTDLSFFTADPAICADAAAMFNFITGYLDPNLKKLAISPINLRQRVYDLVDTEIANARAGLPAQIWAKMNSLSDRGMVDKLYEASAAGVQIALVVRGVCCLRPGVPGLSENITVKSILGRFLEHSRVWAFANGAPLPSRQARVFVSSADWMSRNFDRRVEYALEIENATVHDQVLDQVMLANLKDTERSWLLAADGNYARAVGLGPAFDCHEYFMHNPSLSGRGAALGEAGEVPKLTLNPPL
ncbi:RNA degradosome polyphosphate kinase [Novosphingobium sp.]|uniref:RNA degradosome polyphosphate kinase n=1 Tax=Novosphingobium sp. TaxID=1874826 RepID=UPI0035AF5384